MSARRHLIVFVKAPRLGAVKTRLARGIGAAAAWRFYRDTVRRLLRRTGRDHRWRTVLAVTPDVFAHRGRFWPEDLARISQGRGDIGRRMASAMAAMPAGPVVLVGGDIPGATARHIEDAFAALGTHDVVFGPAEDGGFWLIGLRRGRQARRLFRSVRWSGPHTLDDTVKNVPAHCSVAFVERLFDVDTAADYLRYVENRRGALLGGGV